MAKQTVKNLVWIDLETTGLSTKKDKIIEIGILVNFDISGMLFSLLLYKSLIISVFFNASLLQPPQLFIMLLSPSLIL